jgi:hypothetical protein
VKTISLKKVSAVAVAALAIGSTSAIAPAYSAEVANGAAIGGLASLTLGKVTATPTVGSVVVVKLGMSINAIATNPVASNTYKIQGALTTVPSGGSVGLSSVTTGAGATQTGTLTPIIATAGTFFTATPLASVVTFTAAANGAVLGTYPAETDTRLSAQTVTNVGGYNFTPTKAGTYVLTVWQDTNGTGDTPSVGEVSQTLSITVAAAAALAPAQSFLRMAGAGTLAIAQDTVNAAYTTTLDATPRSATVGATAATRTGIAKVAVVLLNNDGTAAGLNHTVDCQITGSGLCVIDESGTANVTGGVRAFSFANTAARNVSVVHLITDGTPGAGTVTIAVTDSVSGVRTVIGTKSFTSFGAVTKLAVSTSAWTIGRAGFTTGLAATARAAATTVGNAAAAATVTTTSGTSTSPAFIVKATDAVGNASTAGAAPTIVSGTPSVVSGGTCLLDDGLTPTISSSTNGVGFYNCDFATTATAASGSKATLTIRIVDPAGDGTTFITTTLDVTVGGSVSTETIAFDKTSYAPGEGMTITRTAKDSAGNPVFDGAAAPAITFSKAVGGTAPGASIYVAGTKSSTSSGVQSVFAPSVAGAFTAIATSGNTAATALTAASSVADANAGLLTQIDALNAKIVALNALIAKIMKKLGVK